MLGAARRQLGKLATNALKEAMRRRQLAPLSAALAAAEGEAEGVVAVEALEAARALLAALAQEPARAPPAPSGAHPLEELVCPAHIDPTVFESFAHLKDKATTAINDYKYWGGAEQPWRNGVDDTAVVDEGVIESEEVHKRAAEDEDAETAGIPAHAESLRGCGVRVDFLLGLTFALDMWEWRTWEVVQYLVKPVSEAKGRCRFAALDVVWPYTGAASVFMSHCWGGRWGDLVASACVGGDTNRIVWIDVFAVRQWPGNGADLDFRGVLAGCKAVIVSAAPIQGVLTANMDFKQQSSRIARSTPLPPNCCRSFASGTAPVPD